MPVLAAPVAQFSAPLEAVRTYLSVLSSVLLRAAFRPWLRVLHPAVAPVAALGFSTIWFTLQAGVCVMPNLSVALGSVGAIGLYLRAARQPRWWRTLLTALLAAGAAGVLAGCRPGRWRPSCGSATRCSG